MKKILGLDIGTNSVGGAYINLPEKFEDYGTAGSIEWVGSRIIPMDGEYLVKFEGGQSTKGQTKAAFRRIKRGSRRLKHRYILRRTRLIQVFKTLGWLNQEFPEDFKGKIRDNQDFKFSISDYLPFSESTIFEFENEFGIEGEKSKNGHTIIPEDWIIYFLRKKALTRKISIPELVRIIYMLNQRRGFKSSRKDLIDNVVLNYDVFMKESESLEYSKGQGKELETQFVSITKIKSVSLKEEKKDKKGNTEFVYTIKAADVRMRTWEEVRKQKPEWEGKEFTFLVNQKIDRKGEIVQNKPQMPKDDNWALCTTALSEKMGDVFPGTFFFNELKKAYSEGHDYKVRQYPVYRWRYQQELHAIWHKQCELNDDLRELNTDQAILQQLIELLYPTQAKEKMPKLREFLSNDLIHVISNDIIYYQRELKSQKGTISECRYEKRKGIDGEVYGLKCIPRSSPIFQEFRIWQDIHNIRILEREVKVEGRTRLDIDVTVNLIDEKIKEKLFELFCLKASVTEKDILKLIIDNCPNSGIKLDIDKKEKLHSHRVNLFNRREELKGNETLARYRRVFEKTGFDHKELLSNKEKLIKLWHVDYSISSSDEAKSEQGIMSALGWSKKTNELVPNKNWDVFKMPSDVAFAFTQLPEIKKEYGSYSAMAIKKMVPLMRCGKHWNENEVSVENRGRAVKIQERLIEINNSINRIGEIADDDLQKQVLKSFIGLESLIKGLNTYQVGYLIYSKHSEKDISKIRSIEEFSQFIQKELPNNGLRNPIVEQVLRESLLLVRDLWQKFGQPDEIHVELGRELKNNEKERKRISENQNENFNEKQRTKRILRELLNEGFDQYIDDDKIEKSKFEVNPNPESPIDIDKFRIWRSLSKISDFELDKKLKEERIPKENEIKKYVLWLSQGSRSPYTGRIIPLSKLFDSAQYEIEHIIPRAKLKNDSFNNLVIAEWGVNKAKGNRLASNFIWESKGKCKHGDREYTLLTNDEYENYCRETFKFQKSKRKNLLASEVPNDFVDRQLNDTRYIGRKLAEMLAPVAKKENGIVFTGGMITSELKKNWGLNKEWKKLMLPRFERLEIITGNNYISINKSDPNDIDISVPENPKLELKRIDHRHHALDALIIAATTREHIRYLNSLNAVDSDEELKMVKRSLVKGKIRDFKLPWDYFTKDARETLEETIVSFKTNNKIFSKPYNRTAYWKQHKDGAWKKDSKLQKDNLKWLAVRKSMFKEPQGIIFLKEIYEVSVKEAIRIQLERIQLEKDSKKKKLASYIYDQEARPIIKDLIYRSGISIEETDGLLKDVYSYVIKNPLKDITGKAYVKIRIAKFVEYAAKRVTLDKSFDHKKINKIPYAKVDKSTLGRILHQHLDAVEYKGDPTLAFSGEGLEELGKKVGKPVSKVTIAEQKSPESKFGKQYVETDAGSNAFFIIYENEFTNEREFKSLATHQAIENLKEKGYLFEDREGYRTIILSPNDLVYVPTQNERLKIEQGISINDAIDWNNKSKISSQIYKMNSCTGTKCEFVPHRFVNQNPIIDKIEFGANNINQRARDGVVTLVPNKNDGFKREDTGTMIKEVCIKLKVDRLGNISI